MVNAGSWEAGRVRCQSKLSVKEWASSGNRMYSMKTVVNNIILHMWNVLRPHKRSHHTQKLVTMLSDGCVN